MKVLHILNYVGRGGSESYIKNLVNTKNPSITHELVYNIDGDGLSEFKEIGMKATQISMNSSLDLMAAIKIKHYVKENNVDLVHTHFMRENGIAFLSSLIGMKAPIINTRHMVSVINKNAAVLNRLFFTRNHSIFAVSSIVREKLIEEGVHPEKIITLPPPFPLIESDEAVEKPEGEKWILSVGRLSEEKGPLFFIDALEVLFHEVDNVKVLIIGNGRLEEETRKRIEKYHLEDKIVMLGYNPKPYHYLKSADLYVNHSREEAFGLSVVEAAQCKAPLLITQNCGASDYFNEENESALTYPFGDKGALAKKASAILKDPDLREKLVNNAEHIVTDVINREAIIAKIEKTYEGAIHGNEKA